MYAGIFAVVVLGWDQGEETFEDAGVAFEPFLKGFSYRSFGRGGRTYLEIICHFR